MKSQNRLIHIALICLFLYAAASLLSVKRELRQAQRLEEELKAQLVQIQENNRRMMHKLEAGFSDEELQQLARQKLGLVMPGEKIFYFITDREA